MKPEDFLRGHVVFITGKKGEVLYLQSEDSRDEIADVCKKPEVFLRYIDAENVGTVPSLLESFSADDREDILLLPDVVPVIAAALAEAGDRKKLMNFIDGLYAIDRDYCSHLQIDAFAASGVMGFLLGKDREDSVYKRTINSVFCEHHDFCDYGTPRDFDGAEILYLFDAPGVKEAFLNAKAGRPVYDRISKHEDQISMMKSPAVADFFVKAGFGTYMLELVDARPTGVGPGEKYSEYYIVWTDEQRTAFFSDKKIAQSLAAGAQKDKIMAENLFKAIWKLPGSAQKEISKALGDELFSTIISKGVNALQAVRSKGVPGHNSEVIESERNDNV